MAFLVSFWLGWRQSRLDVESLRQQRDTDIIHWSNSALSACCHAEMLLRRDYAAVVEPNPYERERFKVLEDLSYAIDAGRLYFPNSEADKYGLHKEGVFRGVRHPVLDMLVRVYDLLEKVTIKFRPPRKSGASSANRLTTADVSLSAASKPRWTRGAV